MTVFYANNEVFPLKEILIQEKYLDDVSSLSQFSFKRILSLIENIIEKDDLIIDEILLDEISYFQNENSFGNKQLSSIKKLEFFFFNGSSYRSEFFWLIYLQIEKILSLLNIDFLKKNTLFLKKTFNELDTQFNELSFLEEKFKKDCCNIVKEIKITLLEENSIIKVNKIKDKIILLQEKLKKKYDRCIIREINLKLISNDDFFDYKGHSKQEIKNLFHLLNSKNDLAIQNLKKNQYNQSLYLLQDIIEGLKLCITFIDKVIHKRVFTNFFKIEKKINPFIEKVIYNLESALLKKNYFLIEQILNKEVNSTFLLMERLLEENF